MLQPSRRLVTAAIVGLATVLLAGCGTVDSASSRLASAITPYKIEIVQGNFVSKEQVAALQKGMTKLQVREVLGTPLIVNLFRADQWDYVFTIKRPGVEPQQRRLSLYFEGEQLARFEGDEMPTEAEFVATLDARRGSAKVPVLQATEDQLKRFPARAETAPIAAEQKASALPAPGTYPPLEASSGR